MDSKLLFGRTVVMFTREMVEVFGMTGAIIMQFLYYKLQHPQIGKTDDIGRRWLYVAQEDLCRVTDVSADTVQRVTKKLMHMGVLRVSPGDEESHWFNYYSIDYRAVEQIAKVDPLRP